MQQDSKSNQRDSHRTMFKLPIFRSRFERFTRIQVNNGPLRRPMLSALFRERAASSPHLWHFVQLGSRLQVNPSDRTLFAISKDIQPPVHRTLLSALTSQELPHL
jgi:hypothetical protein